jgi:hypothetical protein
LSWDACIQGPAFEAGTPEDVLQGLGWTPPRGLNIRYSGYFLHHATGMLLLTHTNLPKKQFLDLMQLLADDQS